MAAADKESSAGPPGDRYCNWLPLGKKRIKQRAEQNAKQRLAALKKVVPQSVHRTLQLLKQPKYSGAAVFPSISDQFLVDKLLTEWDALCLDQWTGPQIEESCFRDQYESKCLEFGDTQSISVSHAFWVPVLSEIWKFCECIASEIFSDPQHIQLAQHLSKCLSVCVLPDVLQQKITLDDGNKTDSLLSRKSLISNVQVQEEINRALGLKLDVERWAQTEEEKKVFKRCGMMIQKEAGKNGKAFKKLFNVHRLNMKNAKKQREQQRSMETKTMESVPESARNTVNTQSTESTQSAESTENAVSSESTESITTDSSTVQKEESQEMKDCSHPTDTGDDPVEPNKAVTQNGSHVEKQQIAGDVAAITTTGQESRSGQKDGNRTDGAVEKEETDTYEPLEFTPIPTIKQPETQRQFNAAAVVVLVAIILGLWLRNSGII